MRSTDTGRDFWVVMLLRDENGNIAKLQDLPTRHRFLADSTKRAKIQIDTLVKYVRFHLDNAWLIEIKTNDKKNYLSFIFVCQSCALPFSKLAVQS